MCIPRSNFYVEMCVFLYSDSVEKCGSIMRPHWTPALRTAERSICWRLKINVPMRNTEWKELLI